MGSNVEKDTYSVHGSEKLIDPANDENIQERQ